MHSIKIFPSLISGDLLNLKSCIETLEPHCDGFHIDVMDYHFVPNLTWGPMFINAIATATKKPLYVHLMIEKSNKFINTLSLRANDTISFHIEEQKNIPHMINLIKEKKCLPSLAISPKTDIEGIFSFLSQIDQVLLLSVEPGFSGQQFLKSSVDRLDALVNYRKEENLNFKITMDGGINKTNLKMLMLKGVDYVGIAAGIFAQPDPIIALKELYASVK